MEAMEKTRINKIDAKQAFIIKNLEGYKSALNQDVEDAEVFFERLMEKYPDEPQI